MAIISQPAHQVGDVGSLWPTADEPIWVEITAPDGQQLQVKRQPPGAARVWLLQAGEWTYRWDDGETGAIQVVDSAPEIDEPMVPVLPRRWAPGTSG